MGEAETGEKDAEKREMKVGKFTLISSAIFYDLTTLLFPHYFLCLSIS